MYHLTWFTRKNNTTTSRSLISGLMMSSKTWMSTTNTLIAIITIYFILILAGIVLNGVVVYVMVKRRRYRRNISSFFITHLSAVDLIYRMLLTPSLVYLSMPTGVTTSTPCKTSLFVVNTCAAAVFGSLVVIAIDRYRNIIHPLRCFNKTKRPGKIVLGVWIYALASSFMFLHTGDITLHQDPGRLKEIGNPIVCDVRPGLLGGISLVVSMVMIFLLPLVTIIVTYTAMFISLRRNAGPVNKTMTKIKAKSARMLLMVVAGFVVCFGPSFVGAMIHSYKVLSYKQLTKNASIFSLVTDVLELCSSLVNPIIYGFYSSDFRQDVIDSCRPRPKKPKHEAGP